MGCDTVLNDEFIKTNVLGFWDSINSQNIPNNGYRTIINIDTNGNDNDDNDDNDGNDVMGTGITDRLTINYACGSFTAMRSCYNDIRPSVGVQDITANSVTLVMERDPSNHNNPKIITCFPQV